MSNTTKWPDITSDLGPLAGGGYENSPIPMYSYTRPAWELWQAVYEGLREGGRSHAQAVEWLQSKYVRHALDGKLGDKLRAIGKAYGLTAARAA